MCVCVCVCVCVCEYMCVFNSDMPMFLVKNFSIRLALWLFEEAVIIMFTDAFDSFESLSTMA